jgi:hypothetical protein
MSSQTLCILWILFIITLCIICRSVLFIPTKYINPHTDKIDNPVTIHNRIKLCGNITNAIPGKITDNTDTINSGTITSFKKNRIEYVISRFARNNSTTKARTYRQIDIITTEYGGAPKNNTMPTIGALNK